MLRSIGGYIISPVDGMPDMFNRASKGHSYMGTPLFKVELRLLKLERPDSKPPLIGSNLFGHYKYRRAVTASSICFCSGPDTRAICRAFLTAAGFRIVPQLPKAAFFRSIHLRDQSQVWHHFQCLGNPWLSVWYRCTHEGHIISLPWLSVRLLVVGRRH